MNAAVERQVLPLSAAGVERVPCIELVGGAVGSAHQQDDVVAAPHAKTVEAAALDCNSRVELHRRSKLSSSLTADGINAGWSPEGTNRRARRSMIYVSVNQDSAKGEPSRC